MLKVFSILLLTFFTFTVDPAPEFTLIDREGEKDELKDFQGKVIYLAFWAIWCKPCLSGFQNTETVRQK